MERRSEACVFIQAKGKETSPGDPKEEGGSVSAIYSTFGFLPDSSPKDGNERV